MNDIFDKMSDRGTHVPQDIVDRAMESRMARIAGKIVTALSEMEIPIMYGMSEIAKEAKARGMKVEGPIRTIAGFKVTLENETGDTNVGVTAVISRSPFGTPWFVTVAGIVNNRSISGRQNGNVEVPEPKDVVEAVHALGRFLK